MSEYLPFLVIGVTTGSLYGLAGIGLVLTYRTSGIFNFAHGTLAAAAAYLFYSLHMTTGWPWPVAMLTSVTTFGLIAGVVMEWLARSLGGARTANIIVATVGLYLFIQGALVKIYGPNRRNLSQFLPTTQPFEIGSVPISWADIINVGVGVGVFVAIFVFLRSTRTGLAMQAVVADRSLLSLAGTDPVRVSRLSWIFGCTIAALTGILIAPTLGLDTVLLSALVVQAFGAVAIGRFVSLPLTYVGGLVVGVLAQLAVKEYAAKPPWDGLPGSVPFIILILVMLISQSRRLPVGAGRASGRTSTQSRRWPGRSRLGMVAGVGMLVLIPELVGARLPVYHAALIFALLFLSLGLLTGLSGQISLAHAAFAGVGAAVFSHVAVDSGVPWLLSLLIAGGAAAVIGIVLALPAMRLSGLYLALATYGFALMMDLVIFRTGPLFGDAFSGLPGTRPELGSLIESDDRGYYYVTLVVVVVCAAAVLALSRSRLGLYLRGMSESSTALNTLGLNVNITRVIVFATSAFFAGVAGALYIGQIGRLSALSFGAAYSLLYLAVFVVASVLPGMLVPAFVAAGLLVVVPSYISSVTLEVQSMLFGGSAVAMAVLADRAALWAALRSRLDAWVDATVASGERRIRSGPLRARTAMARSSAGGQR